MASDSEDAAIQRELGALTTAVKHIQVSLERSDEKSDESRHEVRVALSGLKDRTTTLEHQHLIALDAIGQMRPVIDEVKQWKQRGLGALGIVGIAATAFGITVVHGWDIVKGWLAGIFS